MTTTWSQSALTSRTKCKGFVNTTKYPATERGTILHNHFSDEPIEVKDGKKGSVYRGRFTPFHFDHDYDKLALKAAKWRQNNPKWFNVEGQPPRWLYERYLIHYFEMYDVSVKVDGFLDRLHVSNRRAIIADFKTGQHMVDTNDPKSFYQAIQYAYLVFCEYPFVDTVDFIWLYTELGERKNMSFSRDDLDAIKTEIYFKVKLTEYIGYRFCSACSFCDQKKNGTCPLINSDVTKFAANPNNIKDDYEYITLLESELKRRKEEIKEVARPQKKWFTTYQTYRLDLGAMIEQPLTEEQREMLLKKVKTVTVKKDELDEFKQAGFAIKQVTSERFKGGGRKKKKKKKESNNG